MDEQQGFSLTSPLPTSAEAAAAAAPAHPTAHMRRRGFPFVWATWLSGLLSGDQQCWWRVWVKVHFQRYDVLPDPDQGNLDQWKAAHAAMIRERVDILRAAGHRVTVEDENAIKVKGRFAILMGKPDIVVHGDGAERIEDGKGGEKRGEDVFQVRIYGLMRRMQLDAEAKAATGDDQATDPRVVSGVVFYDTHQVEVTPAQVLATRPLLSEAMRRLSNGPEPEPVPSAFECGRCDIAACPKRYVEAPPVPTEDF